MIWRLSLVGLLVGFATAEAIRAGAQPPALDAILARAASYTARYVETLGNLTADERYVQEIVGIPRLSVTPYMEGMSVNRAGLQRRVLRSDVVLLNVGPPLEWRPYRDVFEVDGKPVRDRDDRLARLFKEPAATAQAQALRIAQESARFNISSVGRTLNAPGLPIVFLLPALQSRFGFVLDRRDGGAGAGVWIVSYKERARPTLFRHNTTENNPSSGRFWIEAETGEIIAAEHIVAPPGIKATFTTLFSHDDRFDVSVPTQMREQVAGGVGSNRRLDGTATYDNFRRFGVSTEEGLKLGAGEPTP